MQNLQNMENRIRSALRLVNQQCISEDRLRDALTRIDEIMANETGRGNEISPGGLSGQRAMAIQRQEWQVPLSKRSIIKKWVHKTDLLEIRPAVDGEMVAPGQFSKPGDMIIIRTWPGGEDFLIDKRNFDDYTEVEVSDM